jgi:hypothetical protein
VIILVCLGYSSMDMAITVSLSKWEETDCSLEYTGILNSKISRCTQPRQRHECPWERLFVVVDD